MKWVSALAAALLQIAGAPVGNAVATPVHLRFERAVMLPSGASGQACAVLDATVFAHAATEALNDVRLYTQNGVETPFTVTESETQGDEGMPAKLLNVGLLHGDLAFDIAMPDRPYTEVDLDLNAKDFVGTARVTGLRGRDRTDLGGFAVFDFSAQHLARNTAIRLQESDYPMLHTVLHLATAPGVNALAVAGIVQGVSVPPSREAQTLYVPVAETSEIVQRGRESVATVALPEHVPVERVSFALPPEFEKNFLRTVSVVATADGGSSASAEAWHGEISRMKMVSHEGSPAIDETRLSVDAVLGVNLRSGAVVKVSVDNGNDAPLPLSTVKLEMRQRKVCFDAVAGTAYLLRYGDAALRAPVYDYARLFAAAAKPVAAMLGAERMNAAFVARKDARPYTERHPELLWIGLLAVIGVVGSVALRSARRQGVQR